MLRFCFIAKTSVTNKVYQILVNKTSLAYLVSPPLNTVEQGVWKNIRMQRHVLTNKGYQNLVNKTSLG